MNTSEIQGLPRLKRIFGKNMNIQDTDTPLVRSYIKEIDLFSDKILISLKNFGTKFYIGNIPVTGFPNNEHLTGITPRGWPKNIFWDIVAGCYAQETKSIYLGKGEHGSISLVGHEVGHVISDANIIPQKILNKLQSTHKKYYERLTPYFKQTQIAFHNGKEKTSGFEEFIAESIGYIVSNSNRISSFPNSFDLEIIHEIMFTFKDFKLKKKVIKLK
jgi:hypothetical protein